MSRSWTARPTMAQGCPWHTSTALSMLFSSINRGPVPMGGLLDVCWHILWPLNSLLPDQRSRTLLYDDSKMARCLGRTQSRKHSSGIEHKEHSHSFHCQQSRPDQLTLHCSLPIHLPSQHQYQDTTAMDKPVLAHARSIHITYNINNGASLIAIQDEPKHPQPCAC